MEKIAIVGMACLFPGAKTPEEFWRNLMDSKDSRSPATDDKWRAPVKDYYDPRKGEPGKFYCLNGGYVRDFEMDPTGFRMPAEHIQALDDVFQWSLHVAREALKDAGYLENEDALAGCGVILGNLSMPTKYSNHLFLPIYYEALETYLQELLGNKDFHIDSLPPSSISSLDNGRTAGYPAALIAKALNLSRRFLSLDAACASSLYSTKIACDYLLTHKADMMLAGAVSAADPMFIHMGFCIFQACPEESSPSAPLDKKSAGLVAGEGAGMFVLKRYSDAIRDGDKIYATILGTGLSNDGRGQSVLSPNPKGQKFCFERAYASAEIDPKSVQYVECHATGTVLGDKVEIDSMDDFFGKYGATPLVGSVKSNLGHMLSAAGMASMTKVILAMAQGVIPPTINITDPQSSANNVISRDSILTTVTPWPENQYGKHTAVSAFGLGGTNAHMIIGQDDSTAAQTKTTKENQSAKKLSPMAIVGMDALFGSCQGLSVFHRTIYDGTQHFIDIPPERWKGIEDQSELLKQYGFENGKAPQGAYIESFDVDFLRYKIPPNEDDRLIPQQLLALKVADGAIRKAKIEPGTNVAVIVAMETELALHQMRGGANLNSLFNHYYSGNNTLSQEQRNELIHIAQNSIHKMAQVNQYTSFIGNIMASRISSVWDFSGPAFTISSDENSVFKALEVAQMMLDSGEVDAVVVGAVDFSAGLENVLLRNMQNKINTGEATLSFDQNVNGWMVGEGAGAVVLKRSDTAKEQDERIYATINAIGLTNGISEESIAEACGQAFKDSNIKPSEINYLEVSGSGLIQEDEAEIAGLIQAYKDSANLQCAIGSVKANIGHTFAASGMASLIKTALCLYHRYIPGTPQWSAPKLSEKWEGSPFYVPTESKTWFLEDSRPARVAAVSGLGQDGTSAHIILSKEEPTRESPSNSYLLETPPLLFPLAGEDQAALLNELEMLKQEVQAGSSLTTIARNCLERSQKLTRVKYALPIMGSNKEDILQEIGAARIGMEKAFTTGEDWISLKGSYFTTKPLADKGKIAFVYPGGLNTYVGIGRDLLQVFPHLYEEAYRYSSHLEQMIGDKLVYPRSITKLSQKDLNAFEKELIDTPITMFESGILFALLYTKVMREYFQIEPQMALGYSMGEVSMWYALGVWGKTDEMSRALRNSPVYKTRLAGPMETVREAWNLPKAKRKDEKIWYCFTLKTSAAQARKALENESRAYLLFINSPSEVIIAGEEQACKRTIEKLDCEYFEVPMSDAIHCEIARADYDGIEQMHVLPINNVTGIDFYSADTFAPIAIDSEGIANNIATIYCHEIDFARLVRQAYDDGARVFIELGARQNCTNWIGEILAGQEHLAVAANRKGADDKTTILKALAKLYSHRVNLDLAPLYVKPDVDPSPKKSLIKTTTVGGTRIGPAIINKENRKRFAPIVISPVKQPLRKPLEQQTPIPVHEKQRVTVKPALSEIVLPQASQFDQNLSRFSFEHSVFLETRRQGMNQIAEVIQLQMTLAARTGSSASDTAAALPTITMLPPRSPALPQTQPITTVSALPRQAMPTEPEGTLTLDELLRRYPPREKGPQDRIKPPGEIFDYWDLREYAEASIAKVFGQEYAIIDTYKRRVRIPMEPYLLVTRITKLDAQTGVFKPSSMTTEYDIPYNAWYSIDGQIPWAVAVESGQCDLWLISYLGIDFEAKSDRVYRLLDCTLTFLDRVPQEGDTLRYDIRINSFAKTAGPLLFFFEYDCYVKDQLIIEMRGGCAGFFTDAELDAGKGIIRTEQEILEKQKVEKKEFAPLLTCAKKSFGRSDLVELAHDNDSVCFGPNYDRGGRNPSMHLTVEPMLMMDRVVSVDPKGGAWGLGLVIAEKDLAPDHWYFPCHFKDDPVLAGSLMAEGCGQLMRFYMCYIGLQTCTENAQFQPVPHLPQKVRCRGQVIQKDPLLTYRMEVKEISAGPKPYAIADVDILLGDKIVVDFKDLGMLLFEKDSGEIPSVNIDQTQAHQVLNSQDKDKNALFTKYHLEEFATGSVANCFGPEFSFYENRQAPRTPNGALQFVDRVLKINGTRMDFKNPASVVTEFDVPEDIWFLRENSHPAVTPYSVLMEISLQPNGFISAWTGTTLISPDTDFCFRNLDGEGTILRPIDLRGKTITNYSELLSTVTAGNTMIQQFRWELSHEGQPFFKGTAAFGYFLPEALVNQIGLDRGIYNNPLQTREYLEGKSIVHIDLKSTEAREQLYRSKSDKPYYHLASPQLDFLDEVHIVERGGKYEQGYICGYKKIDPTDWFYPCHFYQDPVMPGSLGVESILQAMQIFALQQDLGAQFKSPKFTQLLNHKILWKYRGQLIPTDDQMAIEIHIKKIDKASERVSVIADASLWKNEIRIYAITDAAICLEECSRAS